MLWLSLAICVAAGWFLARAFTGGAFNGPRWASFLVEISLGVLFGPGLASILFFGLAITGAATQSNCWIGIIFLLAFSTFVWWKATPVSRPATVKYFPWSWVLGICAVIGIIFLLLDFQAASAANPQGEWDAMSIWNLRARYFASGGDLWQRALSSEIGGHMMGAAHPAYPLFLSAFLALGWISAGTPVNGWDSALPIAVSLLIAIGALALLGSSLASRSSVAVGILGWLILLSSEIFASQASAQYSDLLQALAFLATLVLLDAATETASTRIFVGIGVAAGLSAWVKNEGLPFAVAALAIATWKFRARGIAWLALGAMPGLAGLAGLKLFLAKGSDATLPHNTAAAILQITQAGRWWQAALGFGKAIYDAGAGITHPVLLAALLALALRFIPAAERRARAWLWIPIAVTAAAEYGLYLVTEANLDWHISTSVSRLVAQLWPALIWLFFMMLRAPEELIEIAPAPVPKRQPAKRARA